MSEGSLVKVMKRDWIKPLKGDYNSRVTPDSKVSGVSPAVRNNIDTVEKGRVGDNRN